MTNDALRSAAVTLLTRVGYPTGDMELLPICGRARNRVLRVELPEDTLLLKAYSTRHNDHRDRLSSEYEFIRFAWDQGVRQVPQPLACDRAAGAALYEYIDGEPVEPADVNTQLVDDALDFFRAINAQRHRAGHLPDASEACFSLGEHLECVERRLEQWEQAEPLGELDREAMTLVLDELHVAWRTVVRSVVEGAATSGLSLGLPLPSVDRRVSPSDFGFHNALMQADGTLRFVDFEAAGWDDPAKTVCDFFCQTQVPVPRTFFEPMVEQVTAPLVSRYLHQRRIFLLLPVYHVKWCLITLSDLLPTAGTRHHLAASEQPTQDRKRELLADARRMLADLVEAIDTEPLAGALR